MNKPNDVPPEFDALFVAVSALVHVEQMNVLTWIAADPTLGVSTFEGAGGTVELFNLLYDDDLVAIYVALSHARDRDQACPVPDRADRQFLAARCARTCLRRVGLWSDEDHFGLGSQWTAKRLARLFEGAYPCASIIEMHTRNLLDLHRRLTVAQEHLKAARELLTPGPCEWGVLEGEGNNIRDFYPAVEAEAAVQPREMSRRRRLEMRGAA